MDYLADINDLATITGLPASAPALILGLKRATGRFRGEVGHPVSHVADEQIKLNGSGTRTLLLPAAPVTGTPTIAVNGEDITDFQLDAESGIVRRTGKVWPDGLGNVEVTYSHGYRETPEDVQDAVLEQAQIIVEALVYVQQESAGNNMIGFGQQATVGVTQRWADAVARYQLARGIGS